MDRASAIFCAAAIVASLLLSAIGFHFAALPQERYDAATTPQDAATLPDVEVTGGFGKVPVLDLVGYYLENPPDEQPAASAAAPASTRRFGGC